MFRLLLATSLVAAVIAQQYGANQVNYNQQPAVTTASYTKQAGSGNYGNDGAATNYGNQAAKSYGTQAAPAANYGSQAAPATNYGSQAAPSANYGKQQGQASNVGRNSYDQNGNEGEGMPYEFSWFVKDDPSQNDYAHSEKSDGKLVTGSYRVALPDGRTQIVSYRVEGDSGFVADVKYEGEARVDNNYASKPVTQGNYQPGRPNQAAQPAQANYRPQVQSGNAYAPQNNAPQNSGYAQQAVSPQQNYVPKPEPAPTNNYASQVPQTPPPAFAAPQAAPAFVAPQPAPAPAGNYQQNQAPAPAPAYGGQQQQAPAPAPAYGGQQPQAPLPAPAYGGQGPQSQAYGQASSAGYAVATASAQSYAPAAANNFQSYTPQNNQNNYGSAGSAWPVQGNQDAKSGQRTYRHLDVPEDVDVFSGVFGKRTGNRKFTKLI